MILCAGQTEQKQRHRLQARPFTLVETVLAIAVFSIMMIAVFRFFGASQRVWTSTVNMTEVYENSRVAFDVITRDLQCSMAETGPTPDQDIRFFQPSADELWFVKTIPSGTGASSNVVEVAYKLTDGEFTRAMRDDTDARWNVHGPRASMEGSVPFHTIVDGVLEMEFQCLGRDGQTIPVPTPAQNGARLPAAITVRLSLIDKRSASRLDHMPSTSRSEFVDNVARTVMKTVVLANRS